MVSELEKNSKGNLKVHNRMIYLCTSTLNLHNSKLTQRFRNKYIQFHQQRSVPCGLVVRIPGFHPGGPGSIPGMGTLLAV